MTLFMSKKAAIIINVKSQCVKREFGHLLATQCVCVFCLPQTVIACGVSYAFDFRTRYGIDVVGYIPRG